MTTPSSSGPDAGPTDTELETAGLTRATYERRYWTLGVLCLSLVLIVAGNSALNVTLPTLVRELDATQTQLQWIVDAYAIVFAGLLLPAGALGDRYGRKGALQFGLTLFSLASLGATFATSPEQLIVLRSVMGLGAAFVMPSTLSLLSSVFPARERAKAIAIWAGFAGAGGAIGPILSGLLLERFWWGSVFFINIPIAVAAILAGIRLVPTSRDRQRRPLDPVGALLSVIGLSGTLFGIIEGPERGWASALVVTSFVVGGAALVAFWSWERRTEHPMLDVSWFRDRRFSIGASTISLAFFAFFGLFFLLTQYLQFVLGYSPLRAGVATLPMAVMLVAVAPRSADLVARFGPQRVVTAGLLSMSVGFGLMTLFTPTTSYWGILVPLVLMGAGGGAVMPPSTGQIMSALPLDRAGVGSAINDTTREFGGSLGVAVLGSIVTSAYRTDIAELLAAAPAEVREVAQRSVAAALQIAQNAPDPAAAQASIRASFTDATGWAFAVAAIATLVNALIVWRFGPRETSHEEIGAPTTVDATPRTAAAPPAPAG